MTTDYVTPELSEMIADAIESALLDVHVALPGRVQSYDVATQTARVELGVHRRLETDTGEPVAETLPVLENVPVQFPRVAGGFLSFPITAGDPGLVVFCEASIDQWRSKGTPSDPGDVRRHSLTGGVFVPGLAPNALALTDPGLGSQIALGDVGGAQVRIGGGLVQATSGGSDSAADFVALALKTKAALDFWATLFDGWTPLANDGGAALKTAWTSAKAGYDTAVASSNLKADP